MNFNFREIGSKLSTSGWITVGVAALVGVLFIYLLMNLASSPSYTTVVAGQSPAQAGKVTAALSAAGIPYQLSNNGTAVSVEPGKEAGAGVLDSRGYCSAAIPRASSTYLGKTSLGESNLQQQQQRHRPSSSSSTRMIEGMNGISQRQVELAIPDQADNLFTGTNTQPSASVLLNTERTLGSSAVKAIADTVAGTVSGFNANKVTVTDQNGDLLWPAASGTGGTSLTSKQSAENAYDTQIAEEADAMLARHSAPARRWSTSMPT